MSFFGFDTTLPERRSEMDGAGNAGRGAKFTSGQDLDLFAATAAPGPGAQEDIAVYTWGSKEYDGLGDSLLEAGDDANDETFGDAPVGTDFVFSHHATKPAASRQSAPHKPSATLSVSSSKKPLSGRGKKNFDPFATTEADFFAAPKKSSRLAKKPLGSTAGAAFGASSSSDSLNKLPAASNVAVPATDAPVAPSQPPNANAAGKVRTLAEIEAEMLVQSTGGTQRSFGASTTAAQPVPQQGAAPAPRALTMEELEREMMSGLSVSSSQPGQTAAAPPMPAGSTPQSLPIPAPQQRSAPIGLPGQPAVQAMFPPLGSSPASLPAQGPLHDQSSAGQQPTGTMQQQLLASLGVGANAQQAPAIDDLAKTIQETELADAKRRKKALKIASMAKYNDIMTGGDKEFITRIQLSQLVSQDPYTSDFYAQVFTQVARAKFGANPQAPTVVQVGSDGRGLAVNTVGRGPGIKIKDSAMQRMTMQVKRIVENAKERSNAPSASLQGALGKTKARAGVAAPRQALQVSGGNQAERASSITRMLAGNAQSTDRREPLTKKEVMLKLEGLYEFVLEIEQWRREQPPIPPTVEQQQQIGMPDEDRQRFIQQFENWQARQTSMVATLYEALMIHEPLDISDPHPFISLLAPAKGHRLLNRCMRHFSPAQALTVLILLLACYPQLDVVRNAPPWLYAEATVNVFTKQDMDQRKQKLRETESYLQSVYSIIVGMLGTIDLKMLAGMLSLCLERWDVIPVLSTRPGTALFTAILSRAEILRRPENAGAKGASGANSESQMQWSQAVSSFVQTIAPRLPSIFPSSQAQAAAFGPALAVLPGFGQGQEIGTRDEQEGLYMDAMDGEVWGVLASLAVQTPQEDQPLLVSSLREKILHTVHSARKGWVSPRRADVRLKTVNLFLGALGLRDEMIE